MGTIVSRPGFEVLVQCKYGTILKLLVKGSDKIAILKRKIHEKEGILPEDQILEFKDNELEDNKTLAKYSITSGAIIILHQTFEVLVQLENETPRLKLLVKKFDTIATLKLKISKFNVINPYDQILEFEDEELDDDKTLANYSITSGALLFLRQISPTYWSKRDEDYRTIDITDDAEFIKCLVYDLWDQKEVGKGRQNLPVGDKVYIRITNVKRVENVKLFREYYRKRSVLKKKKEKIDRIKALKKLDPDILTTRLIIAKPVLRRSPLEMNIFHDINEHYLFHGTSRRNVESICKEGFKVAYASRNLMLGKGIYTAEDPTKSDHYTEKDRNEPQMVLLCRVGLGEMFSSDRPAKELKNPPCRTSGCYKQNCQAHEYTFDSAVADIENYRYREFVVYKDHRIYPEYIITYERTEHKGEMV